MIKLLVVDDSPINRTVMEAALAVDGLETTCADSGSEALRLTKTGRFDLIFMDHMMPQPDGVETLRILRSDENNFNRKTPVVVLTANDEKEMLDLYRRAGFSAYLKKPVSREILLKVIRYLLPKQAAGGPSAAVPAEDEPASLSGAEAAGGQAAEMEAEQQEALVRVTEIPGINVPAGMAASGGPDVYISVLQQFADGADEALENIRAAEEAGNLEAYRIAVHTLKTSARLIGAESLSAKAKRLEQAAIDGKKSEIGTGTWGLIKVYREIGEALGTIFRKEEENLPLMKTEEFDEAMRALCDFVTAFDYDGAEEVLDMVAKYEVPAERKELYAEVRKSLAAVDRGHIIKVLSTLCGD